MRVTCRDKKTGLIYKNQPRNILCLKNGLPSENVCEDKRCYDGSVRLHDELRCLRSEFAPSDFLIRNSS